MWRFFPAPIFSKRGKPAQPFFALDHPKGSLAVFSFWAARGFSFVFLRHRFLFRELEESFFSFSGPFFKKYGRHFIAFPPIPRIWRFLVSYEGRSAIPP